MYDSKLFKDVYIPHTRRGDVKVELAANKLEQKKEHELDKEVRVCISCAVLDYTL